MPRSSAIIRTTITAGRPPAHIAADTVIPFAAFAAHVKNTENEIWTALINQTHGRERHTLEDWLGLIDRHSTSRA